MPNNETAQNPAHHDESHHLVVELERAEKASIAGHGAAEALKHRAHAIKTTLASSSIKTMHSMKIAGGVFALGAAGIELYEHPTAEEAARLATRLAAGEAGAAIGVSIGIGGSALATGPGVAVTGPVAAAALGVAGSFAGTGLADLYYFLKDKANHALRYADYQARTPITQSAFLLPRKEDDPFKLRSTSPFADSLLNRYTMDDPYRLKQYYAPKSIFKSFSPNDSAISTAIKSALAMAYMHSGVNALSSVLSTAEGMLRMQGYAYVFIRANDIVSRALGCSYNAPLVSALMGTGLITSWNRVHLNRHIRGILYGNSGYTGGVEMRINRTPALLNTPEHAFERVLNYAMRIDSPTKPPFTEAELRQIYKELYFIVGQNNLIPFYSQHFNAHSNGIQYPVIAEEWKGTLVGEVLWLLDFLLKCYLNGGAYSPEFLRTWHNNGANTDRVYLEAHRIDLKKSFAKLGIPYTSFRELSHERGLELHLSEEGMPIATHKQYSISFRIIGHIAAVAHEEALTVLPERFFKVEYTIEPKAIFKSYVSEYMEQYGSYPQEYLRLSRMCQQVAKDVERTMPLHPLFAPWFHLFRIVVAATQEIEARKAMGLPLPQVASLTKDRLFPESLPPIPVRYYKVQALGGLSFSSIMHKLKEPVPGSTIDYYKTFNYYLQNRYYYNQLPMPEALQKRLEVITSELLLDKDSFTNASSIVSEVLLPRSIVLMNLFDINTRALLKTLGVNATDVSVRATGTEDGIALFSQWIANIKTLLSHRTEEPVAEITAQIAKADSLLHHFLQVTDFLLEQRPDLAEPILISSASSVLGIADGSYYKEAGAAQDIVGGCGMEIEPHRILPLVNAMEYRTAIAAAYAKAPEKHMVSIEVDSRHYLVFNSTGVAPTVTSADLMGEQELATVHTLLDDGQIGERFNSSKRLPTGDTLLQLAIAAGVKSAGLDQLLQRAPYLVTQSNHAGYLAIHSSAYFNHRAGLELLLKLNPLHLELKTHAGYTPLMIAAECGHTPLVQALLKLGANPNHLLPSGMDALSLSILNGRSDAALALLDDPRTALDTLTDDEQNILHRALSMIPNGLSPKVALALIVKGASLTKRRASDAYSPLELAASLGLDELIDLMIERGANPQRLIIGEATALSIAARHGQSTTVEKLLTDTPAPKPAHIHKALMDALRFGQLKAAFLLAQHCPLDVQDKTGKTATLFAAEMGFFELSDLLVQRGENPMLTDKLGHDYAYYLLQGGEYARYKALAEVGIAEFSYNRTYQGISSLAITARAGHSLLADYLRQKRAVYIGSEKAIIVAAQTGDLTFIQQWLKSNTTDTPLPALAEHAAKEGQKAVLELIGCPISPKILAASALSGDEATMRYALSHLTESNKPLDSEGNHVSHLLARAGHHHLFPLLKEHGISFRTRNNKKQTAYHSVILSDDAVGLRTLLALTNPEEWPKDLLDFALRTKKIHTRAVLHEKKFTHSNKPALPKNIETQNTIPEYGASFEADVTALREALLRVYLNSFATKKPQVNPFTESRLDLHFILTKIKSGFPLAHPISFRGVSAPLLHHLFRHSMPYAFTELLLKECHELFDGRVLDSEGNTLLKALLEPHTSADLILARLLQIKTYFAQAISFLVLQRNDDGKDIIEHSVDARKDFVIHHLLAEGFYEQARALKGRVVHRIVQSGNPELLNHAIALGFPLDEHDEDGLTPLMIAAKELPSMIHALIAAGADPNTQSLSTGDTALHYALIHQAEDAALALLKVSHPKARINKQGYTPYMLSIVHGVVPVFATLYPHARHTVQYDHNGYSAVHLAALFGRDMMLQRLLSDGAMPDEPTAKRVGFADEHMMLHGQTPLQLALEYGQLISAQILLHHGANLLAQDSAGYNAFAYAARNPNPALLDFIRHFYAYDDEKNQSQMLENAAAFDNVAFLEQLYFDGVYLDSPNRQGITPLQRAAAHGAHNAFVFLLEQGADLDAPCLINEQAGFTALHFAAQHGSVAILNTAINYGAVLNQGDAKGRTAVFIAAANGHIGALIKLAQHHADLTLPNKEGVSPAEIALHQGHIAITKLLFALGDHSLVGERGRAIPEYRKAQFKDKELPLQLTVAFNTAKELGHTLLNRAIALKEYHAIALLERLHPEEKGPRHPEQSEGSLDSWEMVRQVPHDVVIRKRLNLSIRHIEKDPRHPEQSEGSPDSWKMVRNALHGIPVEEPQSLLLEAAHQCATQHGMGLIRQILAYSGWSALPKGAFAELFLRIATLLPSLGNTARLTSLLSGNEHNIQALAEQLSTLYHQTRDAQFPDKDHKEILQRFATEAFPLSTKTRAQLAIDIEDLIASGRSYRELSLSSLRQKAHQLAAEIPHQPDLRLLRVQLLAVLREAVYKQYAIFPYSTQMLVVLGMLHHEPQTRGTIAQVRTGEGKSLIVQLLAAYHALLGERIDIITANQDLAKRDAKEAYALFTTLGLSSGYVPDKEPEANELNQQIRFGTAAAYSFVAQRIMRGLLTKEVGLGTIAICDEKDSLVINDLSSSALMSGPAALDMRKAMELVYNAISVERRPLSAKELRTLPTAVMEQLFQEAQIAQKFKQDIHYIIEQGEVVILDYHNTRLPKYGMRWQGAIHQFVEMRHGIIPKADTITYSSMSIVDLLDRYQGVYGLTGTAGEREERRYYSEVYRISSFDAPSHLPRLLKTLPVRYFEKRDDFEAYIRSSIHRIDREGRAHLLAASSIRDVAGISTLLKTEGFAHKVLTGMQAESTERITAFAGKPKSKTIATIAGRGTNIKADNLHVTVLFYPESKRVEAQLCGRAARNGNPGSCELVLFGEDLPLSWRHALTRIPKDELPDYLEALRTQEQERIIATSRKLVARARAIAACQLDFYSKIKTLNTLLAQQDYQKIQQLGETLIPANSSAYEPSLLLDSLYSYMKHKVLRQAQGAVIDWVTIAKYTHTVYINYLQQQFGLFLTAGQHQYSSVEQWEGAYQTLSKKFHPCFAYPEETFHLFINNTGQGLAPLTQSVKKQERKKPTLSLTTAFPTKPSAPPLLPPTAPAIMAVPSLDTGATANPHESFARAWNATSYTISLSDNIALARVCVYGLHNATSALFTWAKGYLSPKVDSAMQQRLKEETLGIEPTVERELIELRATVSRHYGAVRDLLNELYSPDNKALAAHLLKAGLTEKEYQELRLNCHELRGLSTLLSEIDYLSLKQAILGLNECSTSHQLTSCEHGFNLIKQAHERIKEYASLGARVEKAQHQMNRYSVARGFCPIGESSFSFYATPKGNQCLNSSETKRLIELSEGHCIAY